MVTEHRAELCLSPHVLSIGLTHVSTQHIVYSLMIFSTCNVGWTDDTPSVVFIFVCVVQLFIKKIQLSKLRNLFYFKIKKQNENI